MSSVLQNLKSPRRFNPINLVRPFSDVSISPQEIVENRNLFFKATSLRFYCKSLLIEMLHLLKTALQRDAVRV